MNTFKNYCNRFFLAALFLPTMVGCALNSDHPASTYRLLKSAEVVLYLPTNSEEAKGTVQAFFSTHEVMVAPISRADTKEGHYWVEYPSMNSGARLLYSHRIKIQVPENFPVTVKDLIEAKSQGVLVALEERFSWKLVGYVSSPQTGGSFDWFSKHQNLLYAK